MYSHDLILKNRILSQGSIETLSLRLGMACVVLS